MTGPLHDVRVIDFTHALNGPFCTMLLGHLGAEVIKVEPPSGDNYRRSWMPADAEVDGYEFLVTNANKKSIVINLKTPEGLNLARRLIAVSDILVENYYPGTMDAFGLDYESVRQINPRLIYACSRGYGDSGPYRRYGSNAGVNNAMAGWTHAAWEKNRAPGTGTMGIGDQAGGVSMAVGILAALHERAQSGEGQHIEVAMQEALLGFMVSTFHTHFTGNKVAEGGETEVADGYFALRTPDRARNVHLPDWAWKRLVEVMKAPELATDTRFATEEARKQNRAELGKLITSWAKTKTRRELWDGLRDIAYFGAPVLSIAEVMDDEHVTARGAFIEKEHPVAGTIKLLAPWIRMSRTPATIREVSPLLGQHTNEILGSVLGVTEAEIESLRSKGAVQ
jgi:crotonobetainyl-CoA:carnitine CoA-transferase CaiB-like acyl-CoA transferase